MPGQSTRVQVCVGAHGSTAGIGMFVIAARAQDGRAAQPSEHLLTQGVSGEEGHHTHRRELSTGSQPAARWAASTCLCCSNSARAVLPNCRW